MSKSFKAAGSRGSTTVVRTASTRSTTSSGSSHNPSSSKQISFGNIRMFGTEDIELLEILGEGNFGIARKAIIRAEGEKPHYAVVKIAKFRGGMSMENMRELIAMSSIKPHPNLLKFLGLVTIDNNVCFIVDYCARGSIDRMHQTEDLLARPRFLEIIRDVSAGLTALHKWRMVHRDLACRNLLVKQDGTVVLCDYGLSRKLGETSDTYVMTSKFPWAWTAPEALRSKKFTFKSDIWAFGVTLWEIATKGERPYARQLEEFSSRSVSRMVQEGKLKVSVPAQIRESRPFLGDLVDKCLRHVHQDRPSAASILRMTKRELGRDAMSPRTNDSEEMSYIYGSGLNSAFPLSRTKANSSAAATTGGGAKDCGAVETTTAAAAATTTTTDDDVKTNKSSAQQCMRPPAGAEGGDRGCASSVAAGSSIEGDGTSICDGTSVGGTAGSIQMYKI